MIPWFVYFAKCADTVKIGTTQNIPSRLRQLRYLTGVPVELLGVMRHSESTQPYGLERAIHCRFSHLRIQGEWFAADHELLKWIAEVPGMDTTVGTYSGDKN